MRRSLEGWSEMNNKRRRGSKEIDREGKLVAAKAEERKMLKNMSE